MVAEGGQETGNVKGDNLSDCHIAIYGLGLMGGSLAMALQGKCAYLTGIEVDATTISLVKEGKVVDALESKPGNSFAQADLIILATPIRTILEFLSELPNLHPGPAVVIDLASTKRVILQSMKALPERFDPLGGHPMCGKEASSFVNAERDLYQGAPFAFTRLNRTSARACELAEEVCQAIGAKPVWLQGHTHDTWVAATSHLPYLIANALAAITPEEVAPLVGPGFRSTTRIAATPIHMMRDILSTNRDSIVDALKNLLEHLQRLESQLASEDFASMEDLLQKGLRQYTRLTKFQDH